jgi:hypothetical protein
MQTVCRLGKYNPGQLTYYCHCFFFPATLETQGYFAPEVLALPLQSSPFQGVARPLTRTSASAPSPQHTAYTGLLCSRGVGAAAQEQPL